MNVEETTQWLKRRLLLGIVFPQLLPKPLAGIRTEAPGCRCFVSPMLNVWFSFQFTRVLEKAARFAGSPSTLPFQEILRVCNSWKKIRRNLDLPLLRCRWSSSPVEVFGPPRLWNITGIRLLQEVQFWSDEYFWTKSLVQAGFERAIASAQALECRAVAEMGQLGVPLDDRAESRDAFSALASVADSEYLEAEWYAFAREMPEQGFSFFRETSAAMRRKPFELLTTSEVALLLFWEDMRWRFPSDGDAQWAIPLKHWQDEAAFEFVKAITGEMSKYRTYRSRRKALGLRPPRESGVERRIADFTPAIERRVHEAMRR